uniref:Golgi integral membrane protein 4 isoform X2 n=1 Tax=Geotrypetes seraphini TaxID=260995 RepID=A0A6P8SCN7_GEOSA|nr:Golgi integral membrane protein 4 isoform X2 [Geotrypetes seraphini]
MRGPMGNGVCSRRQRRVLQTLLLLAAVLGFVYGAMVTYDLQKQLKRAEATALKYQQHQETMSAQLQVVYEHRSRLEKSLQKERVEHKKVKEDFLVYKLEAQETLNKGRQDSNNRYSALNVQHQMLKNQHEDLKKQHSDLQAEHQKLGEDLTKTFSDNKQKYLALEQVKEQELSKVKENVYNLREENKQLRKAHQDMHLQLQDVKKHKNLLTQHDQVVLALEDHKGALAAAQGQIEEYRVLKHTLKKMPSLKEADGTKHSSQQRQAWERFRTGPSSPSTKAQQKSAVVTEPYKNEEKPRDLQIKAQPEYPQNRLDETDVRNQPKKEAEMEHPTESDVQHQAEEAEEHKKELEEEEMEQVGQPERLVEEQDQVQEEHEWKAKEQHEHGVTIPQSEENGQEHEEDTNLLEEQTHFQRSSPTELVGRPKSAYEEQLEQQRLMAQKAQEARSLKERQDALREHLLKQQQLREQQVAPPRQTEHRGQLLHRSPLRQRAPYDNLDHDIVQGKEQAAQEEGGAHEREERHHDEEMVNIVDPDFEEPIADQQQAEAAAEEENPANDPNNQGEDEFEEAEQEREENPPDENEPNGQGNQKPGNPGMEEHLVMAGNPDQQEDNIDEQYQEEGEEEVQEDLADEKKRPVEHNGEAPYGEHEDNANEKNSEIAEKELDAPEKNTAKEAQEENYEEEEEEDEEGGAMVRTNRKAEM